MRCTWIDIKLDPDQWRPYWANRLQYHTNDTSLGRRRYAFSHASNPFIGLSHFRIWIHSIFLSPAILYCTPSSPLFDQILVLNPVDSASLWHVHISLARCRGSHVVHVSLSPPFVTSSHQLTCQHCIHIIHTHIVLKSWLFPCSHSVFVYPPRSRSILQYRKELFASRVWFLSTLSTLRLSKILFRSQRGWTQDTRR